MINNTTRKKIAIDVFKWCVKRFGSPLKRSYPELILIDKDGEDIMEDDNGNTYHQYGNYIDRKITLFINNCDTKSRIIDTLIHEYTHFLQMPKINGIIKYAKMSEIYEYDQHPMEIEAVYNAKKYKSACYQSLSRKNLYN